MEKLEKTVDKIALEVVKHTEAIKGLVTKGEFSEFRNENFTRLDNMMVVLSRLDEERVFTIERVRRIEKEIGKIKSRLALT
ncbi:MAG: hypothetical protein PHQ96_09265 [Candidatus Omnitrophica bacterium]|nr:hypothetical protein [Candidatus Omnitrophota bacterium]